MVSSWLVSTSTSICEGSITNYDSLFAVLIYMRTIRNNAFPKCVDVYDDSLVCKNWSHDIMKRKCISIALAYE